MCSYLYANDLPYSSPAKPPATVIADTEDQHESPNDTEEGGVSTRTDQSPSPSEHADDRSQRPDSEQPPLPKEVPPPLPDEPPPDAEDDGWEPVWDQSAHAFYFYNKHTKVSQWENPRVPEATVTSGAVEDAGPPGVSAAKQIQKPVAGGYDPAIHGDYDPNADYAKVNEPQYDAAIDGQIPQVDPAAAYAATGAFNRFTGKWQSAEINPDKFSDENKSRRQMNAFFDVDAAANSHDGRSLKAERSGKRVSKAELKAFREKRREKKEEKRRAWLRD